MHDAFNIARKATPDGECKTLSEASKALIPDATPSVGPIEPKRQQAEFKRFRKVGDDARRPEWGNSVNSGEREREPFRSLEAIVNIVERGRASILIEERGWEGVRNYGEIVGFRNRADGDRWDVFVPGLLTQLPVGEPLRLRRIYGVVLVKGGNHKLAVEVDEPYTPESRALVNADVQEFIKVRRPRLAQHQLAHYPNDSIQPLPPASNPRHLSPLSLKRHTHASIQARLLHASAIWSLMTAMTGAPWSRIRLPSLVRLPRAHQKRTKAKPREPWTTAAGLERQPCSKEW